MPCACRLCEGRLALAEKVGEGGFGSVWRCGEKSGVVVKFVRVDLERDVNALKAVLDEARHLLELRHEHVVESARRADSPSDESRRRRGRDADMPPTRRGDAAAGTWICLR